MILRNILFWAIVFLFEGIIVIMFLPPTIIVNAAYKEEAVLSDVMGTEISEAISTKARESFNSWFVESGVMAQSFSLFVPTEAEKRTSKGIESFAEPVFEFVRKRLESGWNLMYVGIQRIYSFATWLPLLLPFGIACLFDGGTVRRIKLLSFGMSSAPIFGAAMHVIIILAFFPLLYAAWPFAATPLIVPLWFISLSLVIRTLVANLQRM